MMRKKTLERQVVTTKIGNLPPSWKAVSLKDVTDPCAPIRYGVVQIGPNTPGGVPIVPIKHIKKIKDVTLHCASSDIEAAYAGSRVKGGDVLLSVKGTIGEIGVVPNGFEGNIAREIARIRPVTSCDAYFLAFQLEADHTQRRIDSQTVGSTRLEFSIHAVRDFLIALPPLAEQKKIAAILRTWDEGIKKLEQHICLLQAQYKFVSTYYFDTLSKKEKWMTRSLVSLAKIRKGQQLGRLEQNGGAYPVWNGGITASGYTDKPNAPAETITVSEGGNSCGFVNLIPQEFWLGGHCYALTVTDDKILKSFLYLQLKHYESKIMALRVGSGLPNIQKKDLEKFNLCVPDVKKQEKVISTLQGLQKQIDLQKNKKIILQSQKRGLMQKLLTGEWPVRVEKEAA